jgi:hypothetical protein
VHISNCYHVVTVNTLHSTKEENQTSQPQVIFENEEASQLLDYFIAYRKLISKAHYFKCMAAVNSQISFQQISPNPTKDSPIDPINENQIANPLPTQTETLTRGL